MDHDKKSLENWPELKSSLKWEAFLRNNEVFGFDHLHASECPSMSPSPRGLALTFCDLNGWSLPSLLTTEETFGTVDVVIQLSLSLYHMKSKSFFGSTWMGEEVLLSKKDLNNSKINCTINDIVYIISRITDASCVCLAEVVVSLCDERGIKTKQFGYVNCFRITSRPQNIL